MTDQDKAAVTSEEVAVVPLDEPSMEDYGQPQFPTVDEFGAPIKAPVKILDGVQDTAARKGHR